MGNGRYDVAQICLNGHVMNDCFKSLPQHNRSFCERCGATTITTCQKCNASIPGHYSSELLILGGPPEPPYSPPAFCHNCGAPYPWTESRLQAARELAHELEDLTDEEKSILAQNLDDIVGDTPRTTLAATRWKKVLSRAGPVVTDAFRQILVDVMSETAKKIVWPQS